MKKIAFITSLVVGLVLAFSGCTTDTSTYYTVQFITNSEDSTIESQKIKEGELATKPKDPTRTVKPEDIGSQEFTNIEDYEWGFHWWVDGEGHKYDFSKPVYSDMILYADWGGPYNQPYDKKLGNGNYVLHNFIGEYDFELQNSYLDHSQIEKDTNHYLSLGSDYIQNCVNDFNKSLEGRPAAQEYFKKINNITKAKSYMKVGKDVDPVGFNIDRAGKLIGESVVDYCTDVLYNLDNRVERNKFVICYEVLSAESAHFGKGSDRINHFNILDYSRSKIINSWNSSWNKDATFDIQQDFEQNNCQEITNTMDSLLTKAVKNMNEKQNLNLQVNDLRGAIKMGLLAPSVRGVDQVINTKLHPDHNEICQYSDKITNTLNKVNNELYQQEKQQSRSIQEMSR